MRKLNKIIDKELAKLMQDPCPFMCERCGMDKEEKVYNWGCFGKYNLCKYYQRLKNDKI